MKRSLKLRPLLAAFAVAAAGYAGAAPQSAEYGQSAEQADTLRWIWEKAQKHSGLADLDRVGRGYRQVKVILLSQEALVEKVCPQDPENCRGLAANFDRAAARIWLREDLVPERDLVAAGVVLHEFVHVLQAQRYSDAEMYGDCTRMMATETQAYVAQDKFLRREGVFSFAGSVLQEAECRV